jgi:Ca2+-transporting ATPase
VGEGLTFLGLVGLQDPLRPEAREAVARCEAAGIRVVMITGDHPRTAHAIAGELALGQGRVLTGAELEALSDEALARRVAEVDVYARAAPAHKLRIVRAWQARGQVVAMTGDGVNDAPAIAGADVGISMGRGGTEVTRQAAAMVITDDDFATIVAAVEEGRGVYANIRKTMLYLLGGNAAELLVVGGCALVGTPLPLLPIHLLWINVVTDGLPALALAADRPDPAAMVVPPRPAGAPLLDPGFLRTMVLTAALSGGVTLAAFEYGLCHGGPELARTLAFATLVSEELIRAYGARSETQPLWRLPALSNPTLAAVVAASLLLQPWLVPLPGYAALFHVAPLPWGTAALVWAWAAVPLAVLELRKALRRV